MYRIAASLGLVSSYKDVRLAEWGGRSEFDHSHALRGNAVTDALRSG
jgi:hypothetical protein